MESNSSTIDDTNVNDEQAKKKSDSDDTKMLVAVYPTPLEFSCWSKYPTAIRFLIYCLFIISAIAVSSLIVYFTTPKNTMKECKLNFKKTPENPIEYNYGPRSVVIIDLNNDSFLDFIVANQQINEINLYLGKGDGSFSPWMSYSTGSYSSPSMIAVGDLNNDHRIDITVANFGNNNISIFLSLDNELFAEARMFSTGASRPVSIYLNDFNDDQQLDLVTANYGTESVTIHYGDGNGSFVNSTTYSTGFDSFPSSVIAADFNNDHHLDLAIAIFGTDNIGILFGYGNESFTQQTSLSTKSGSRPISIVTGYFNDDPFYRGRN